MGNADLGKRRSKLGECILGFLAAPPSSSAFRLAPIALDDDVNEADMSLLSSPRTIRRFLPGTNPVLDRFIAVVALRELDRVGRVSVEVDDEAALDASRTMDRVDMEDGRRDKVGYGRFGLSIVIK
jgi:hypothetical protein